MNKASEVRQLEMAVRFVLMGLREGCGQMPTLSRPAWHGAARLLRLDASIPGTWRQVRDIAPFLEASGFDKDGYIVDYEKLYAYLDAHKAKPRKKLRSHNK